MSRTLSDLTDYEIAVLLAETSATGLVGGLMREAAERLSPKGAQEGAVRAVGNDAPPMAAE